MSELDRKVGGLRCRDVLALLADYVDGELDAPQRERVEDHLVGCDRCEKFGGEYRSLVVAVRQALRSDASSDVRGKLQERMRAVWAEPGE